MTAEQDERIPNARLREFAHELRNPLASIMSSVELIQILGGHDTEAAALLSGIEDRVRIMAKMIDALIADPSARREHAVARDSLPIGRAKPF